MTDASGRDQNFIGFLKKLAENEDRAALAVLRRGASQSSAASVRMYRYVANWVGEDERGWKEECLYVVAALFAGYPNAKPINGNFGESMRLLRDASTSDSIERRFTALLAADTEGLRSHLRHMIDLFASKGIALNWLSLLRDLRRWKHPARYVERSWARGYWRSLPSKKEREIVSSEEHKDED